MNTVLKFQLSIAAVVSLFVCQLDVRAEESPRKESGLLVVVHGSPSPKWNEPMVQLEADLVYAASEANNPFLAAKVVNLEFKKPQIADGVKELIEQGSKRIVCMPLFIARSSHVLYDIPAALGQFLTKEIYETLEKENIEIASSAVPVVVGPTLADGDLLLLSSLERVKEISRNPEEEAVVILAHGDEGISDCWDTLIRRTAGYISAKTGITYTDWAYVQVGQTYGERGLAAIHKAGRNKKRVLAIGLYLSMGVQSMHERSIQRQGNPFEGESYEVVLSSRGFLPDPRLAGWLIQTASGIDRIRFKP